MSDAPVKKKSVAAKSAKSPAQALASHALASGGVIAACVLAVVLNVLGARHYKRWDATSDKRYTLSAATLETLHGLSDTIDIWVFVPGGDPLRESVKQTLAAYQAETTKLDVHWLDPDRNPQGYADARRRFKMDSAQHGGANGSTDAIMVVARGDKHWFIAPTDLVEIEKADDPRAKPREEKAFTLAIRNVLGGEKTKLCFVTGHGELALNDGSEFGLGFLQDVLEKDNYETSTVDTTLPNAAEPFKGCDVVVIPGVRGPFAKEEENRLRTYLMSGGSALLALSPITADSEKSETGMSPPGLAAAFAPFGIGFEEALVFETEPTVSFKDAHGIRFIAQTKPHAVTQSLQGAPTRPAPRTIVHFARPLRRVPGSDGVAPQDLLVTTTSAYAVTNIVGAAQWPDAPAKKATDLTGPFVLAMASERPKVSPAAAHGPRVVVIGTGSAMIEKNWRLDGEGRGMAVLVENSIAWLAAKPQIVDVPTHAAVSAGIRITADSKTEIRNYVLFYIPLAVLCLGLVVFFYRRSSEGTKLPSSAREKGDESSKDADENKKADKADKSDKRDKGRKKGAS
ncbi:MAG: GldG family protein [Polyangiaceae bacterium]